MPVKGASETFKSQGSYLPSQKRCAKTRLTDSHFVKRTPSHSSSVGFSQSSGVNTMLNSQVTVNRSRLSAVERGNCFNFKNVLSICMCLFFAYVGKLTLTQVPNSANIFSGISADSFRIDDFSSVGILLSFLAMLSIIFRWEHSRIFRYN